MPHVRCGASPRWPCGEASMAGGWPTGTTRSARSTSGGCPPATTSRRTSATSTRATSSRWCTSTSTASVASSTGASCRTSPNQAANVLRGARRASAATAWRCVLPPTPETAAVFFGTWKLGAILLSMSVLYGDEGIAPPADATRSRRVLVTDARERRPLRARLVETMLVLDDGLLAGASDRVRDGGHLGRRPGPALLHLRHDRARQGHRARAPLSARARGVRLLPRGARTASASTAWASGPGPRASRRCSARGGWRGAVRLPARGRLRSAQAARLPVAPRGRRTCSARRRRCAR